MKPGQALRASAVVLLLAAGTAFAQSPEHSDLSGLGVAVNVAYYQTSFAYPKASYDSNITEAGLALGERLSPAFSMWMEAGYARLDQGGNPEQTNFTPAGYYGRIGANYSLALTPQRFGMDFTLKADYHRVYGYNNVTELVQRWWAFAAAAGPWGSFGPVVLEGGLVFRYASGTEDVTGTNPQSLSFGYAKSVNPYFDAVFHPQPDSAVVLHVEGGAWRGALLSFSYNFSSP